MLECHTPKKNESDANASNVAKNPASSSKPGGSFFKAVPGIVVLRASA